MDNLRLRREWLKILNMMFIAALLNILTLLLNPKQHSVIYTRFCKMHWKRA